MAVPTEPLATVDDYKSRYTTTLPDSKIATALSDVSMYLRQLFIKAGKDIDSEIASGELIDQVVRVVVCSMANRVLISSEQAGTNLPIASQISETTGQVSLSYSPVNPTADIYLTKNERKTLGLLNWSALTVEPKYDN
jgi:hypothetical protein